MTIPKCFEVLVSQWHVGTLLKWDNLESLDTEIDIKINDNVHVEFWHEHHSTIDNFHDDDDFQENRYDNTARLVFVFDKQKKQWKCHIASMLKAYDEVDQKIMRHVNILRTNWTTLFPAIRPVIENIINSACKGSNPIQDIADRIEN